MSLELLILAWFVIAGLGFFPAILWNAYEIRQWRKALQKLPNQDSINQLIHLLLKKGQIQP